MAARGNGGSGPLGPPRPPATAPGDRPRGPVEAPRANLGWLRLLPLAGLRVIWGRLGVVS